MVRDIILDIQEKDLSFKDKSNAYVPIFDSLWGNIFDEDESSGVLICNIIVPEGYWSLIEYLDNEYICRFTSEYMPDTRVFNIRLVAIKNGHYSLFSNIRGDFGVQTYSYAINKNIASPLSACMLPLIDIDGQYLLKLTRSTKSEYLDKAYIYSCKETDISVNYSDDQASQLLSLCAPGKSYRYPTTGVGIIRYLNAVIDHTDLYDALQKQFDNDNKPIQSAYFDNETCKLDVLCSPEKAINDSGLTEVEDLNIDFFNLFTDDFIRKNIVFDKLSETDFLALLSNYDNIFGIFLFQNETTGVTRITDKVEVGQFDCDGNIVESTQYYIFTSTLDAGTIVMFDDELEDQFNDTPVFVIDDFNETRLYTSLVEQPYWISDDCHKCFILHKRSIVKYMISQSQFHAGKGLFIVDKTSDNIKNLLALVQDSDTGRLLGIVCDETNISDVVLDEITQQICAQVKIVSQ